MTNKFKHSLATRSIVLRQDDDSSTFIEENGGVYYPIVRINELVVPFTQIQAFVLDIGQSFLPQLTISINDDDFHYRESNQDEELGFVTIFIGSTKDEINQPIKNDYLIKTVESSPGSSTVTFSCELYVPKLYTGVNQAIEGTSIDVLSTIAKECGLGFSTNIQATSDSMSWIQYQNYKDFIHQVTEHAYIDENTSIQLFVDQFANLNVVNLLTAINGKSSHKLEIDPVSGDELDPPINLILTSNKLDTDNPAKISSYTPINNYGLASKKFVSQQNSSALDYVDYATANITEGLEQKQQLDSSSMFTSLASENVHDNFLEAPVIQFNNRQLMQGLKHILRMDWSVQSIYMYQVIPVEIFNVQKKSYRESTDENVNLDQLSEVEPGVETNAHTMNENLSGNCLVLEMRYMYTKSTKPDSNRLRQTLRVLLT